ALRYFLSHVQLPRRHSTLFPTRRSSDLERVMFASIRACLETDPSWYSTRLQAIKGVTEETTTGVQRLYQMARAGDLAVPAINVRAEEHTSELQSRFELVCRLLLERQKRT